MLENKAKIMRLNIYRVETPSLSKIAKWKELKGKICSEGYNDVRKVKKEFHRKGFVAQIYVQRKKKKQRVGYMISIIFLMEKIL